MRRRHDGPIYDDSGRREWWETGMEEPTRWYCDHCGTKNERVPGDDWPTCMYCGRFRDDDVPVSYGWYE